MVARKIQVFFYGSFMCNDVLEEAGIKKRAFAPASLTGFILDFTPFASIVESGDNVVYGTLVNMTHDELKTLYEDHAGKLSDHYHPEAVMVQTRGGRIVPALTYVRAESDDTAKPDPTYVNRICKAANDYGFPKWYRDHLESFQV